MRYLRSTRPGLTLIELLLFCGLLAIVSGALILFFLSSGENQVRQQAINDVDQNGTQLMQVLAYRIRNAERVLAPPLGSSGSVLTLQVSLIDADPTVIGVQSGALLLEQGTEEYLLSDPAISIKNFHVNNTSPASAKPGVAIAFTVSRTLPLPQPVTYTRSFEQTINLFPADTVVGNPCGCAAPACVRGAYTWGVCDGASCIRASGSLLCH